jgi:hypothetical protein
VDDKSTPITITNPFGDQVRISNSCGTFTLLRIDSLCIYTAQLDPRNPASGSPSIRTQLRWMRRQVPEEREPLIPVLSQETDTQTLDPMGGSNTMLKPPPAK